MVMGGTATPLPKIYNNNAATPLQQQYNANPYSNNGAAQYPQTPTQYSGYPTALALDTPSSMKKMNNTGGIEYSPMVSQAGYLMPPTAAPPLAPLYPSPAPSRIYLNSPHPKRGYYQ